MSPMAAVVTVLWRSSLWSGVAAQHAATTLGPLLPTVTAFVSTVTAPAPLLPATTAPAPTATTPAPPLLVRASFVASTRPVFMHPPTTMPSGPPSRIVPFMTSTTPFASWTPFAS
ncbi:hypothetical protein JYU34_018937 [Plutella xylostella]|uniref:Secreted protein n=1 Tax=Plutella xylostella TaxID=51655 RepID=A0ABQ7PYW3_PLUXY|nr:hypothetical protein JYU34_018937 [Plutella xylostella]